MTEYDSPAALTAELLAKQEQAKREGFAVHWTAQRLAQCEENPNDYVWLVRRHVAPEAFVAITVIAQSNADALRLGAARLGAIRGEHGGA